MDSCTVTLADAAATQALGRQLAETWVQAAGDRVTVLLLRGDLGAGKTCLVQGLAAALAIAEPITSPTFALAQHYRGERGALVHLDLYRLEQGPAADELFLQEEEAALDLGALLAVEWPERLCCVPEDCWQLDLELVDPQDPQAGRLATLQVPGWHLASGPRLSSAG